MWAACRKNMFEKIFVIVIPKEGLASGNPPINLFVWLCMTIDLSSAAFTDSIVKSVAYKKKDQVVEPLLVWQKYKYVKTRFWCTRRLYVRRLLLSSAWPGSLCTWQTLNPFSWLGNRIHCRIGLNPDIFYFKRRIQVQLPPGRTLYGPNSCCRIMNEANLLFDWL